MKKETPKEQQAAQPKKGKLRENIEALVIAVLLALFIRAFVVQAFKIPSGSMQDTLLIGDYILVNKFIYGIKVPYTDITVVPIKSPERGDIVVFRYPLDPGKDFIKRVVGLPGDKVEVRNKRVFVNDRLIEEEYVVHSDPSIVPPMVQPRDNFGPVVVPQGRLFTMGDNRDESNDSRFWGFVDEKALRGKAFLIYWSWDREDFGVRWNRLGDIIR